MRHALRFLWDKREQRVPEGALAELFRQLVGPTEMLPIKKDLRRCAPSRHRPQHRRISHDFLKAQTTLAQQLLGARAMGAARFGQHQDVGGGKLTPGAT